MMFTRENVLREIVTLALLIGASIIQGVLMCGSCTTFLSFGRVIAFTFCMWALLWKGNNALTHFVSAKISWIAFPTRRFFIGVLATLIYTGLVIFFLILVFKTFFNFDFESSFRVIIVTAVVMTTIISLFMHSRNFLIHWKNALLDAERFEREKISARYETLKSRVNPQLLHNSLQSLGKLIYVDKENAVKFIKHLSDVYRYILDTRGKELVARDEELKFLNSYFFLMHMRMGPALVSEIDFGSRPFYIIPLCLQLMVEKIIEESMTGIDKPLSIKINTDDECIALRASTKWRRPDSGNELSVVLNDITDRYKFLSGHGVTFQIEEGNFTCAIPLVFEIDSMNVNGAVRIS
jgi:LytS/YehU family sensor histidine kinase